MVVGLLNQALYVSPLHQWLYHIGLAVLITKVVYLHYVGMVAKACHRLGFSTYSGPGSIIQPFGLYQCKGNIPIKGDVVYLVDFLLASLPQ